MRRDVMYADVRLDDEVAKNDWPMLDQWMGMHMVVAADVEETPMLDEYLTEFGWRLARRYHPDYRDRMDTADRIRGEDHEAMDFMVEAALHYKLVLLRCLVARWLAQD